VGISKGSGNGQERDEGVDRKKREWWESKKDGE